MSVHVRGNFADTLDPRFREIIADEIAQQRDQDMLPVLWNSTPPTTPFRDIERYSEVSGLPQAGQFTGSIDYAQFYQGYDVQATYVEFAQGIQIERLLLEYDQKNIIEDRPRALADSMWRRRQFDALRFLRNATSVDTFFYNNSEAVALASNSHTTTTGASTAAGYDNLSTAALSAVNLTAANIQMRGFRDLQAEPINVAGDTLIVPIDLYETAFEIISSMGKVDVATNNRNVHYGAMKIVILPNKKDFPDTNDWAIEDSSAARRWRLWFDQVWPGGQPEFGMAEEFDTFTAKYRGYGRWTNIIRNWRHLLYASVS